MTNCSRRSQTTRPAVFNDPSSNSAESLFQHVLTTHWLAAALMAISSNCRHACHRHMVVSRVQCGAYASSQEFNRLLAVTKESVPMQHAQRIAASGRVHRSNASTGIG